MPPRRGRLLVVDDDPQVREALTEVLVEAGFACATAGDGREAVQRLSEAGTPDVILLDVNMPGMDGMEFLRLAREQVNAEFGVIVMTGAAEGAAGERLKRRVRQYGALTLVEKPIDFAELLRLIGIEMEHRAMKARLRR
jgi:two-component system chemotaxis response regulator CheY